MSYKATEFLQQLLEDGYDDRHAGATPTCTLTRSERLVAFLIATHINRRKGAAWPSVARLAWGANLTEANVRRALRGLEAAGVITTQPGGGELANRYRFPVVDAVQSVDELSTPRSLARGVDPSDPARWRATPRAVARGGPRGGARSTGNEPGKNQRASIWCDSSCPRCDGTGWEEDDPIKRTSRPCRGRSVAG